MRDASIQYSISELVKYEAESIVRVHFRLANTPKMVCAAFHIVVSRQLDRYFLIARYRRTPTTSYCVFAGRANKRSRAV